MHFSKFFKDESAAITVDWVILTAAIVGIAIAVLIIISGGINTGANAIDDETAGATTVAGLISGQANVSDYNQTGGTSTHQHYEDGGGNAVTVAGGVMTDDATGNVVGTVDGNGNITPV